MIKKSIIKSIIKYIRNPFRIFAFLDSKGKLKFVPDTKYLELVYRGYTGKKLKLEKPNTYNEKLQWLKINDRNPFYRKMVDKYEVRSYIANTIGEKYLIPMLGIYEDFNEINFDKLPNQFVLKCTHDSGGVVICKDKNKFDINSARKKINKHLKRDYYYSGREWPYKNLKPRIICEEYLKDNITDYKIMCFSGQPKLIQIHNNRSEGNHTIDFYDINWNKTEIKRDVPTAKIPIARPTKLNEMLEIAKELSKNEIHVRVDLYEVDGEIYFGEKTYYSGSGFLNFEDDEHDILLGNWIKLPIGSKQQH